MDRWEQQLARYYLQLKHIKTPTPPPGRRNTKQTQQLSLKKVTERIAELCGAMISRGLLLRRKIATGV